MAVFNVSIVANLIDNVTSRARAVSASLALMRKEATALAQSGNIAAARAIRAQADYLDTLGRRADIARYQLTTFGTSALVALGAPLAAFNAVEQAFTRIAKAADLPLDPLPGTQAYQQQEALLKGLLDVSQELPNPIREIGEIMEDIVRAGIGETERGIFDIDTVKEITKWFAAAARVFNISLKDTPKKMAVIARLFGKDLNKSEDQIWLFQIMDQIAWLDKNIPGTARNILEFFKRAAPDLKRLGFDEGSIIALGALFESSVGKEAEQSVRTFTSGMQKVATMHMFRPGSQTEKTRNTWAQWLGFKDAEEFYQAIFAGKTGLEALKSLIEALYNVPKEQRDAFIRNAMGLDPMRTLGAITPELIRELERLIQLMKDPQARGTIFRELERDARTLQGQWGLMRNAFTALMGSAFGEGIAEPIKDAMRWLRELMVDLRAFSEEYPGVAKDIGKGLAYLAGLLALYFGGKMAYYIARIMGLASALRRLGYALRFLARNPFMALIGLGLIGGALYQGHKDLANILSESFFGVPAGDWAEFIKNWNINAILRRFAGLQDIDPGPIFQPKGDEDAPTSEEQRSILDELSRAYRDAIIPLPTRRPSVAPPLPTRKPSVLDGAIEPQQRTENYYAPRQQVTAPVTVNVTVNASFQNADPAAVGNAVGNAAAQQVKSALNSALNDGVQGYATR